MSNQSNGVCGKWPHINPMPERDEVPETHYFTNIQQWAVKEFKGTDDREYKNYLFREFLYEPFVQMSGAILNRYPIYKGRYGDEELTLNAITEVVEKIDNFDEYKPTPFAKVLNFGKFEGTFEVPIEIGFNQDRTVSFLRQDTSKPCEYDIPKGFIKYFEKEVIAKKKKTIYSGCTTTGKIRFRQTEKNKYTYFYCKPGFNIGYSETHYRAHFPSIRINDLTRRMSNLKDLFYFDIDSERPAYSYTQTIIRNYFKNHSLRESKEKLSGLDYSYAEHETEEMNIIGVAERHYYMDESGNRELYDTFLSYYIREIEWQVKSNSFIKEGTSSIALALTKILPDWERYVPDQDDKGKPIKDKARKNILISTIAEYTLLPKDKVKSEFKWFADLYMKTKHKFFNGVRDGHISF